MKTQALLQLHLLALLFIVCSSLSYSPSIINSQHQQHQQQQQQHQQHQQYQQVDITSSSLDIGDCEIGVDNTLDYVIGIDIGSSYSSVSVYRNGYYETVHNESDKNNYVTPSYVAFSNGEILVGEAAKDQAISNPQNTISMNDIRSLIGRRYSDQHVQDRVKTLTFRVVDIYDKPYIVAKLNGEDKSYSPEDIFGIFLNRMREKVEGYFFGVPIKHAVITCPVSFNGVQRQSIRDAGALAGLNVIQVIDEPIAACLSYDLNRGVGDRNILVFDFGADKVEVTILNVDNRGVFKVLSNTDVQSGADIIEGEDPLETVKQVLEISGLNKVDISNIVMVCQYGHLHNVNQLLTDFFDGKQTLRDIDPHYVLSVGAAISGARLIKELPDNTNAQQPLVIQSGTHDEL
ncbi:hypothetical protein SAMD00019534_098870 [Acytostelium subglobosum LB1]|uniref:hypothetical protein n=1 Tax=Acytostelium subglobosum LB1 TaxID=1410327 RepID=UPI0006450FAE|nr:hypothetical protein SAMD00019534_098870 [Acytostelium subglobosum LB1]GAM26712.1 hypothetical protein SAMD00019534_098870 [Acytostelium subglobosum LB1]|eukprot:XP_012750373.1 hypothetical protein SAMD00019534_098870 [Acytostelium subglobosum LB1]